KNVEAEQGILEASLEERSGAIRAAARKNADELGYDAQDPQRAALMKSAEDEITALKLQNQEKVAAAQRKADLQTFDEKQQRELALQEVQIAGIKNVNEREMALLNAKYKAELDKAKQTGGDVAGIQAQWDQARKNLQSQQSDERKRANSEIGYEMAKATNAATMTGLRKTIADLELEKNREIAAERDPRTSKGISTDTISRLYRLREQAEIMRARTSAGTFSASEFSRMGGTSKIDEIAASTKETAKNTRKLKTSTFSAR
ncbi:MAG: hypothetical protein WCI73_17040, partial [Phycisphaerae bacterium]